MQTNEQDLFIGLITVSQTDINSAAGNAVKAQEGRKEGKMLMREMTWPLQECTHWGALQPPVL